MESSEQSWFPHDTLLENILVTVPTVTVRVTQSDNEKVDEQPENLMEVDEYNQDVRNMFQLNLPRLAGTDTHLLPGLSHY